ncbi:MAG: AMIN domain-containing protein [Epsilonproteobacteria bacterium]|nr:AMIN domain-containing protein [Campylobacterota bacterium]
MRKILFLFVLLVSVLFSRDNPFKPVVSSETMGKATNIKSDLKPLKIEKIKLPSSVRVIKEIAFKVLNVDGSIKELRYKIDKKVDWHKDILISNSELKVESKPKKIAPKELKIFDFLSVLVDGKKLLIKSDDKMIREMFFVKPYKIALDFKRDVSFYTKTFKIENSPFKSITLGNHGSFYRVVLTLDGEYRYKIKKDAEGYLVELF